ncbi:conserved hypothetical protein [Pseudolactococcus piscium]|nr:conserved hypothetical protein [Lactococcus piscium]
MEVMGSPPQVRVKAWKRYGWSVKEGITPAGAGKSNLILKTNLIREDHPRRCG